MLRGQSCLYVTFRVLDRYVVCRHVGFQDDVCRDSCVEFFVRPRPERGYLNFEINCGGALHVSYIEDATRTPSGFARYTPVPWAVAEAVRIAHSLPTRVDPELAEPQTWMLTYFIPFAVLEHFVGPLGQAAGQVWQGNFYKCADHSSHPHWASWAPIGDELNFHQPDRFADLRLA